MMDPDVPWCLPINYEKQLDYLFKQCYRPIKNTSKKS